MLDNIILGITLLCTGLAAGIYAYSNYVYERPLPSNALEQQKLLEDSKKVVFSEAFKLEKLIINLPSRTARLRFLDVQVHLVPLKDGLFEELEEKKPLIHDAVIDIASKMEPNELNSVAGKILLEGRIKNKVNQILGGPKVKDIFFSKFVVQ